LIELRSISERHLQDVQRYLSDPSISATSNVPFPYPEDGAVSWMSDVKVRECSNQSKVFAVEQNGKFVGVVSLNQIDLKSKSAHIDYWIAAEHQGNGYATIAVSKAIEYANVFLLVTNFYSSCLASNTQSIRVLEKNRFSKISDSLISDGRFKGLRLCKMERLKS